MENILQSFTPALSYFDDTKVYKIFDIRKFLSNFFQNFFTFHFKGIFSALFWFGGHLYHPTDKKRM